MGGLVVCSEIRFGFDNPSGEYHARGGADQQLPQQSPRNTARIAIEKLLVQPGHLAKRIHEPPVCPHEIIVDLQLSGSSADSSTQLACISWWPALKKGRLNAAQNSSYCNHLAGDCIRHRSNHS